MALAFRARADRPLRGLLHVGPARSAGPLARSGRTRPRGRNGRGDRRRVGARWFSPAFAAVRRQGDRSDPSHVGGYRSGGLRVVLRGDRRDEPPRPPRRDRRAHPRAGRRARPRHAARARRRHSLGDTRRVGWSCCPTPPTSRTSSSPRRSTGRSSPTSLPKTPCSMTPSAGASASDARCSAMSTSLGPVLGQRPSPRISRRSSPATRGRDLGPARARTPHSQRHHDRDVGRPRTRRGARVTPQGGPP